MARFFVLPEQMKDDTIVLTGENAQHARVLRLKAGEEVVACDGEGMECRCNVEQITAADVTLSVLERRMAHTEATVRVSVYMAFPKADKLEHVIQKATELGAYEIVAFPSARCISKPDDKSLKKKLERWQKIAASASEQSGRGRIPKVLALGSYREALDRASQADKALLFYENEHAVTLVWPWKAVHLNRLAFLPARREAWRNGKWSRRGMRAWRSAPWEAGFCAVKQRPFAPCPR